MKECIKGLGEKICWRDGGSKEKRKHGVITIISKCIKIKIFKKLKHPTFRCLSAIQKHKI